MLRKVLLFPEDQHEECTMRQSFFPWANQALNREDTQDQNSGLSAQHHPYIPVKILDYPVVWLFCILTSFVLLVVM